MTYQIYYVPKDADPKSRGVCMFDIEYYSKQSDQDKSLWYSEIHCLPCVDGIAYFLKDKFGEEGFDIKEFVADGTEIQEIRGLLWERFNNRAKPMNEHEEFHYHVFGKRLKEILDGFCKKYNCWLNID